MKTRERYQKEIEHRKKAKIKKKAFLKSMFDKMINSEFTFKKHER